MRIGLIDVDGHNFPNLALMRISSYHKDKGDDVEWCNPMEHYDIVYQSKVFSDSYTPDIQWIPNADKIVKGGTGYCISLVNGKEIYDKSKDRVLPLEIERCFPDYSIYPQYDYAVSMTSRGCPRGCSFCHVAAKEGRCSAKVANVSDFWRKSTGKKEIKVLDPNITACKDKRDLMSQYLNTGVCLDFTQGLDIRCINDDDIKDINAMCVKNIHFAWDNPTDDLKRKFLNYSSKAKHKPKGSFGTVYCLTGFNSTKEQDLYRVYTLRDLGYDPYIMIYDKPHASQYLKDLQRWVNNRIIFKSCKTFDEYIGYKNSARSISDENQMQITI